MSEFQPAFHVNHQRFKAEDVQTKDGETRIFGYASVFNNEDSQRDVVKKGAFTKTIERTNGVWPVFLNHESRSQVGMNISAEENSKGLLVETSLYDDALPLAKESVVLIQKAIKHKHPMGLSIGGFIKEMKRILIEDKMQWHITEFDVREHSITPVPANEKAQIDSLKSLQAGILKQKASLMASKEEEAEFIDNYVKDFKRWQDKAYSNFLK